MGETGGSQERAGGRLPPLPLEPFPTAAERVAERLRELIFEGHFPPGTPLREGQFQEGFQVSRNTVREAFRLLAGEGLLAYEMNRGMSVRRLTRADVRDIYSIRHDLEMDAVSAFDPGRTDLSALTRAQVAAERAAEDGDWRLAGTFNLRFHEALVAFLGSPRRSRFFHNLMTEQRLGFCAISDFRALHEPYLHWNRRIHDLLAGGQRDQARDELLRYLAGAEREVGEAVRAFDGRDGGTDGGSPGHG